MRWVLRYVPEYERRWARLARPGGSSWRMDETAVSIRGRAYYLYGQWTGRENRSIRFYAASVPPRRRTPSCARRWLLRGQCGRGRSIWMDTRRVIARYDCWVKRTVVGDGLQFTTAATSTTSSNRIIGLSN